MERERGRETEQKPEGATLHTSTITDFLARASSGLRTPPAGWRTRARLRQPKSRTLLRWPRARDLLSVSISTGMIEHHSTFFDK